MIVAGKTARCLVRQIDELSHHAVTRKLGLQIGRRLTRVKSVFPAQIRLAKVRKDCDDGYTRQRELVMT